MMPLAVSVVAAPTSMVLVWIIWMLLPKVSEEFQLARMPVFNLIVDAPGMPEGARSKVPWLTTVSPV